MPDPPVARIYREALLIARSRALELNRDGLERLYSMFAEALARIGNDRSSAAISAERAAALGAEIEDVLGALTRELARNTERSSARTISDISQLHRQVNRELVRRFGSGTSGAAAVVGQFDSVPMRAVQAMAARQGGTAGALRTLMNRHIRHIIPEVDDFLGAAVARGVSAGRASRDLAKLMANAGGITQVNDRRAFEAAFDRIGAGEIHRGAGTIDFEAYGLDEQDAATMRQLLYDARRIQVSEVNNAHRESNAASMTASPIVTASKWTLSGRHFVEDICDVLAQTDAHGYGPGFYPPDAWPVSPHPHCLCSATEVQFRRPSEWDQPKPASNPVSIDPTDQRHTARWADRWTDRARERYQQEFAAILAEGERLRKRRAA